MDGADTVRYHETVPYAVEDGAFSEIRSIDVHPLEGSMGRGLLLDTGCEPSAPMSGGPWRILGLENGQLAVVGNPIVAEGEFGAFIAGPVTRMGTITQMAADVVTVCVWTGYFFATVPVRIDWIHRTLALAQHCFYQTGHGPAEEGCEGPVQGLERRPTGPDLTFVRMFGESREPSVTPAHVVVKPDSAVTFLASKVRMTWEEDQHAIHLGVDDDLWLKVRVDGREG